MERFHVELQQPGSGPHGASSVRPREAAVSVAPDLVPELLFGPKGFRRLSSEHPDVYCRTGQDVVEALFPPVQADLVTYYTP